MNNFKRYWLWISLLVICISVLIFLMDQGKIKVDIFFTGAATLLTAFIATIDFYHKSDKFFKELFIEFNKRYNAMSKRLNDIAINKLELTEAEKREIIDYLNLCAEEYMWYKKGRIPNEIWDNWKNGISHYLKYQSISKVFEEEKNSEDTYYGFISELEPIHEEAKKKINLTHLVI
jgi:hypothetical protein